MANESNDTTPAPDDTTPEGGVPDGASPEASAADASAPDASVSEGDAPEGEAAQASADGAGADGGGDAAASSPAALAAMTDGLDASEVEKLLQGALEGYGDILAQVDAVASEASAAGEAPAAGATMPAMGAELIDQNLELLRDVHLQVKVELGRGRMYLKDILRLGQGSVVELERLAGDPLDIYVNDKVIARGEVLVLNESFCIRITEVFNPEDLRQAVS